MSDELKQTTRISDPLLPFQQRHTCRTLRAQQPCACPSFPLLPFVYDSRPAASPAQMEEKGERGEGGGRRAGGFLLVFSILPKLIFAFWMAYFCLVPCVTSLVPISLSHTHTNMRIHLRWPPWDELLDLPYVSQPRFPATVKLSSKCSTSSRQISGRGLVWVHYRQSRTEC